VSDYGLDNPAIGVRLPAGAKDFSSNLFVHTGSGAYPVSYTMGTGGPVPGAKHGRGVTLTTLYVSIMRWNQSQTTNITVTKF
jgi:hypothetical protein